ncbi:MAG: ChaN family lipoprotein [Rhodobacteraceae bacterium]|nr:ChaN family lipoprotein [Paracoccaceae bacterium]
MKALALFLALASPATAAEIAPEALDAMATFRGAQVVILGEIHDNPIHHGHQARAVAALQPKALVFEMLPEGVVMPASHDGSDDLAKALGWNTSGWPEFSMYYPIFAAAPAARIYGAEVSRNTARRAFEQGVAAVFGADAAEYGLTERLPSDDQTAREAEQALAHCNALPPTLLPGMVDVQRLRDAALARAVVQALADTGGPVAVITGTGHARRDQGVPAVLARLAPNLPVLSIGQFEEAPEPDAPFDLWLVTDPEPREDPCATLSKG